MAGLSNYLEQALLNHTLRTTAYAQPATLYFSLHSADPADSSTPGNEITGGGYGRIAISRGDATWTAPTEQGTAYRVTNNIAITFGAPSTDWNGGSPITWVGIFDASTGGNLLYSAQLGTPRTILSGDPAPAFSVGSFGIALS